MSSTKPKIYKTLKPLFSKTDSFLKFSHRVFFLAPAAGSPDARQRTQTFPDCHVFLEVPLPIKATAV